MFTSVAAKPVFGRTFIPIREKESEVLYPRIWKSVDDDYNENPIPMSYNVAMQLESWLNSLLESDVVENHLNIIDDILSECNSEQRHQALTVKTALSRILNSENILVLLDENPIDAYKSDDDVILIEWSFKNFGLGFCLAPDSSESGWYVTSNEKAGNLLKSGLLESDQEINAVATAMISMLQNHIRELNI